MMQSSKERVRMQELEQSKGRLAEAMRLKGEIDKISREIDDETFDLRRQITLLQEEIVKISAPKSDKINLLRALLDETLATAAVNREWEDGRLILVNKSRVTRTINSDLMRERFPQIFTEIAKVTLKDAEQHLSKVEVNRLCDIKIGTPSWDVVTRSKTREKTQFGWYQ